MKAIYLFMFFLSMAQQLMSQTTIVNYTYDRGGNMIQRSITVMPPLPGAKFVNPFSQSEQKNDSLNFVSFKVYPNPAKDIVNLEGELPLGIENAKVFLFSSTGQILRADTYTGTIKSINVGDLKAGVYYLEVNYSKKNSSNYKIVITN